MALSSEQKRGSAGPLVKILRKALGPTQRKLSAKVGASLITIQNWEAGRHQPDPIYLRRLLDLVPATALGPVRDAARELERELPDELRREPAAPGGGKAAKKKSRYADSTRAALHAALDLVLEEAPDTVAEKLVETLTRFADKFEEER